MAFIRKATDNPFGAIPHGPLLSANAYAVAAGAQDIFPGDFVTQLTDGTVAIAQTGTDLHIVGVSQSYHASGSAAIDVLVADHPDQVFVMQDDSDTTGLTRASIGLNAALIGMTGTRTNFRSRMEIDSSTVALASATGPIQLLALHPVEADTFATTTGEWRKWLVKVNPLYHRMATGTGI